MSGTSDAEKKSAAECDQDAHDIEQAAPKVSEHGSQTVDSAAQSTPPGPSENRRLLKRIRDFTDHLRGIVLGWTLILFVAVSFGAVYWEMCQQEKTVTVRLIEVPNQLADRGYTSRVVAEQLIAKIHEIHVSADTSMEKSVLEADWSRVDLIVPTTGLSINLLAAYLSRFCGSSGFCRSILCGVESKVVSGELLQTGSDGGFRLQLRVNGRSLTNPFKEYKLAEIDQLLEAGVHQLVREIEPFILAVYYYDNKEQEMAEELISFILNNYIGTENELRAMNLEGLMLHDKNMFDKAIEKYKRISELDPDFALAYSNWGLALAEQGKYEEAVKKHIEAIELDPKYNHGLAMTYTKWGIALDKRDKHDEAIKKYKKAVKKHEKAIKIDPSYNYGLARTYTYWGITLHKQEKYEEAVEKHKRAIGLDHKLAEAHFNLAGAFAELRHFEEAEESCRKAVDLSPKYQLKMRVNGLGPHILPSQVQTRFAGSCFVLGCPASPPTGGQSLCCRT